MTVVLIVIASAVALIAALRAGGPVREVWGPARAPTRQMLTAQDVGVLRALAGQDIQGPVYLPSGYVMEPNEAQALVSALAPAWGQS